MIARHLKQSASKLSLNVLELACLCSLAGPLGRDALFCFEVTDCSSLPFFSEALLRRGRERSAPTTREGLLLRHASCQFVLKQNRKCGLPESSPKLQPHWLSRTEGPEGHPADVV